MNISLKRAVSDAMRMSANSASSMPQPIAAPLIAAIIGFSHSSAAIAAGVGSKRTVVRADFVAAKVLGPAMISWTSSPEQNAGSAPVTMTQRTSSSAEARRSAASSMA